MVSICDGIAVEGPFKKSLEGVLELAVMANRRMPQTLDLSPATILGRK